VSRRLLCSTYNKGRRRKRKERKEKEEKEERIKNIKKGGWSMEDGGDGGSVKLRGTITVSS
jgi:hypothetical protein